MPISNELVQVIAIDILYYNAYLIALIISIIEFHYALMVQFRHGLNFLLEALHVSDFPVELQFVVLLDCNLSFCTFDDSTLYSAECSLAYHHL